MKWWMWVILGVLIVYAIGVIIGTIACYTNQRSGIPLFDSFILALMWPFFVILYLFS